LETGFRVLDAMTKMPITIHQDATITECAQLMVKHDVGSLLVVENGKLVGILTEGDLTYRVIARSLSPDEVKVRDVMTSDVVTIPPHYDIYDALMHMNKFEIRHAPVLHEGSLVGFLTHKDILKIQPDLFDVLIDKVKIREESNKPVHGDIRLIE